MEDPQECRVRRLLPQEGDELFVPQPGADLEGVSIYDLRTSAKQGERQFHNHKWPEWNNGWNNQDWVANVSRVPDEAVALSRA